MQRPGLNLFSGKAINLARRCLERFPNDFLSLAVDINNVAGRVRRQTVDYVKLFFYRIREAQKLVASKPVAVSYSSFDLHHLS
jgi:hypothetical protein